MKGKFRSFASLLLAGFLTFNPALKVLAANDYFVSSDTLDGKILFPGDTIHDVGLLSRGAERLPIDVPDGIWTNDTGTAYRMSMEEGEVLLEEAGCMVTVSGGTSSSDNDDPSAHSTDCTEAGVHDTAVYPVGAQVSVHAQPPEGKVFDHWDVSGEIHLDDPHAADVSFTMPGGNVTLTAVFKSAEEGEGSGEEGGNPEGEGEGQPEGQGEGQPEGQAEAQPEPAPEGAEAPQEGGGVPEESWNEGGEAPAENWNEGGEAPAESWNEGGEAPAESWNEGGEAPAENWDEGGEAPAESWNEGGEAPAENLNEGGQTQEENWNEDGQTQEENWDPFNGGTGTVVTDTPSDTPSDPNGIIVVSEDEYGTLPGDGQLEEPVQTGEENGQAQGSGQEDSQQQASPEGSEEGNNPEGQEEGNIAEGQEGENNPEGQEGEFPENEEADGGEGFSDESHRHHVTVTGGEGTGDYQFGDSVEITAYEEYQQDFPGWTTDYDTVWFADSQSIVTTFSMPDEDVTVSVAGVAAGSEEEEGNENEAGPEDGDDHEGEPEDGNGNEAGPENGNQNEANPPVQEGEEGWYVTVYHLDGETEDTYEYHVGDYVEITAPDEGEEYTFTGWEAEGTVLEDPQSVTASFYMPENEVYLTPQYATSENSGGEDVYTVTVENGEGSGAYAEGETVTISADSEEDFIGWYTDSETVALEDETAPVTTFTMPAEDVIVTADYDTEEPESGETPEDQSEPETPENTDESEDDTEEEIVRYVLTVYDEQGEAAEVSEHAPDDYIEVTAPDGGEGMVFDSWYAEGVELDVPDEEVVSFFMPANDVELTPQYTEEEGEEIYSLIVENGEGSGEYYAGDTVEISGDGADGEFVGWEADLDDVEFEDDTAEVTSVVMPAEDLIVTANYAEEASVYSVILRDINGDILETTDYETGEHVEVDAPDGGDEYQFTRWTADGAILDDPEDVTASFDMPANDVVLTPNYKEKKQEQKDDNYYLISLGSNVSYVSGAGYDASGRLVAKKGTMVTVSAPTVIGDSVLDHWSVTRTASGTTIRYYATQSGTISFTMPGSDVTVNAVYRTLPANNVNVVNGSGGGTYSPGAGVVIRAYSAPAGMRFSRWVVDYGNVVLNDRYSSSTGFTMGSTPVQVRAEYVRSSYSLDVQNGSGDGTYAAGAEAKIKADWPASGKEFNSWQVQSGTPSINDVSRFSTTLVMPSSNVVVTATYRNGPDPAYNAIQGIDEGGRYAKGETLTFTAVGNGMGNTWPNPGDYRYRPSSYKIGSVNGSWTNDTYTTSMAINAVGDYTLTVTFAKEVYDGSHWNPDGTYDTKSVHFQVVNMTSVETGDTTPLLPLIAAVVASLAVIIAVVVLFLNKRR